MSWAVAGFLLGAGLTGWIQELRIAKAYTRGGVHGIQAVGETILICAKDETLGGLHAEHCFSAARELARKGGL